MKIVFYYAQRQKPDDGPDRNRETLIGEALAKGMAVHGDELVMVPKGEYKGPMAGIDAAMMFGVKSKKMFRPHIDLGIPAIYVDKGYLGPRGPEARGRYFKFSVNAMHPIAYFQAERRDRDRFDALKITPAGWRKSRDDSHILVALSSQKYCDWVGQGNATKYAAKLVKQITNESGGKRHIVYRPKPSWPDAEAVKGAGFSRPPERIRDVLRGCHALVTHGSNAAIDALLVGVPAIVLGDGIAKPVAGQSVKKIKRPYAPSRHALNQWLADLAYCQWNIEELASGEAWKHIKQDIWRELRCR